MSLILPYPGKPANGDALDASIVQANIQAIAQAIQSFDASQVSPGTLTAAAFAAGINPNTIIKETTRPFVYSGCTWSTVSGLQGTMTSGVVYVNGIRVAAGGVGAYNFTASQDTYVDVDYNGNVYYLPVGNAATAPALTSNSTRVAKVVTNGTAITSITQYGFDSLGNPIYNTSPHNKILALIHDNSAEGSYTAGAWNNIPGTNFNIQTYRPNQVISSTLRCQVYQGGYTIFRVLVDGAVPQPIINVPKVNTGINSTTTGYINYEEGFRIDTPGQHSIQFQANPNSSLRIISGEGDTFIKLLTN